MPRKKKPPPDSPRFTRESYYEATGRYPVLDDLERANCTKSGWDGSHAWCGVCTHGNPKPYCRVCLVNLALTGESI